jgi:hypothetical protein
MCRVDLAMNSALSFGHIQVAKVHAGERFESRYLSQQLRGIAHSSGRAAGALGYNPIVGFRQSMAMFRRWYMFTRGMESESWQLIHELF